MRGFWSDTNVPKNVKYNETDVGKKVICKLKELLERINLYSSGEWFKIESAIYLIRRATHKNTKHLGDIRVVSYCGESTCRICGKDNGDSEYILKSNNEEWTFPSGYLHYIIDHGVEPSKEFEKFMLNLDIKSLELPPVPSDKLICDLNYLMMFMNPTGLQYSN